MESKDDHPDFLAAYKRDREIRSKNVKCHYAGKPNLHAEGSCDKAIRSVRWLSSKAPRERLLCASCVQYFVPDVGQLWVDWVKENIEKAKQGAETDPEALFFGCVIASWLCQSEVTVGYMGKATIGRNQAAQSIQAWFGDSGVPRQGQIV